MCEAHSLIKRNSIQKWLRTSISKTSNHRLGIGGSRTRLWVGGFSMQFNFCSQSICEERSENRKGENSRISINYHVLTAIRGSACFIYWTLSSQHHKSCAIVIAFSQYNLCNRFRGLELREMFLNFWFCFPLPKAMVFAIR